VCGRRIVLPETFMISIRGLGGWGKEGRITVPWAGGVAERGQSLFIHQAPKKRGGKAQKDEGAGQF